MLDIWFPPSKPCFFQAVLIGVIPRNEIPMELTVDAEASLWSQDDPHTSWVTQTVPSHKMSLYLGPYCRACRDLLKLSHFFPYHVLAACSPRLARTKMVSSICCCRPREPGCRDGFLGRKLTNLAHGIPYFFEGKGIIQIVGFWFLHEQNGGCSC